MFLGIVEGIVVAPAAHPSLKGFKLLICRRLDTEGNPQGEPVIALDALGAGNGTRVLVTSDGDYTRQLTGFNTIPARMAVIGLIDEE